MKLHLSKLYTISCVNKRANLNLKGSTLLFFTYTLYRVSQKTVLFEFE